MHRTKLALVAAVAVTLGVAGCSLPEVLPMAHGVTSGPSPYGPWYEAHWATNAVLLAAADQTEIDDDEFPLEEEEALAAEEASSEAAAEAALDEAMTDPNAPAEASSDLGGIPSQGESADFDETSPYQFPASSFATDGKVVEETAPPADTTAPAPAPPGGAIRY